LAFDTALMGCAAALYDAQEDKAWSRSETMMRGQSERLVPMVQEIIAEAGQSFAAIDVVATTVGPGAFTGLRLGLSAARAWGLSLKRPVAGLTTLEVLAAMFYGGTDGPPMRVLIETKRQDFYTQLYNEHGQEAGPAEAISFADIQARGDDPGTVYIGDAAERFAAQCVDKPIVRAGFEMIDPAVMARLAYARFTDGLVPDGMPQPLYLRGADVSESKRVQRQIVKE
jgi:tRNA threonylcarbamoyladenosine biosynthesis protein TsaB